MPTETTYAGTSYFNNYRIAAWLTHAASFVTTYWLAEYIVAPTEQSQYVITILLALAGEFVLHKMKKMLFDASRKNDALGWGGFAIDALINAGGALPKMNRLAAWTPIAALVKMVGADTTRPGTAQTITAFTLALIIGSLLSVLPIRLDQMADRHQ